MVKANLEKKNGDGNGGGNGGCGVALTVTEMLVTNDGKDDEHGSGYSGGVNGDVMALIDGDGGDRDKRCLKKMAMLVMDTVTTGRRG